MLTGERVVLRPTTPEDYPLLYAWRVDLPTWLLTSDSPPRPLTYADFCAWYDGVTRDKDGAEFAVEVDGALVGRCSVFNVSPLSRHAEVGISFGPDHRGKGYGRDALRVLLDYAFRKHNLNRLWLETLASNVAGLAAYRAAGFVEEGRLRQHAWVDGAYEDVVRMAVLRDEWAGQHS